MKVGLCATSLYGSPFRMACSQHGMQCGFSFIDLVLELTVRLKESPIVHPVAFITRIISKSDGFEPAATVIRFEARQA